MKLTAIDRKCSLFTGVKKIWPGVAALFLAPPEVWCLTYIKKGCARQVTGKQNQAVTLVPLCLLLVIDQASHCWQCQAVARFKTWFSLFADCAKEAAVYPLLLLEALKIFIACVWNTGRSRLRSHVPFFIGGFQSQFKCHEKSLSESLYRHSFIIMDTAVLQMPQRVLLCGVVAYRPTSE